MSLRSLHFLALNPSVDFDQVLPCPLTIYLTFGQPLCPCQLMWMGLSILPTSGNCYETHGKFQQLFAAHLPGSSFLGGTVLPPTVCLLEDCSPYGLLASHLRPELVAEGINNGIPSPCPQHLAQGIDNQGYSRRVHL